MSLTVFMYHRILPEERPEALSVAVFDRQLEYLGRHYRVLQAAEVEKYVTGELKIPGACAALSFDDGWADNLFYADPVLEKHGFSALMAVSAGYLHDGPVRDGESGAVLLRRMDEAQAAARNGDRSSYLSVAELEKLQNSGRWRLEVHGTRHELGDGGASVLSYPQNGLSAEAFRKFLSSDLENARDRLARITGRSHRMMFWPWGHYSTVAVETAAALGLDIQFTVAQGSIRNGDKRRILPRIGASPRWKKFTRNAFVFRHRTLEFLHGFSHSLKVDFDDRLEDGR